MEDLLEATVRIVAAYVSHNSVMQDDLPALIKEAYQAVICLGQPSVIEKTAAVDPDQSVFPDHIVCLEDGKKLRMLKRHLKAKYGLTPQQYRHRWGLPSDYPMTAPNYAAKRSELAKQRGLGRRAAG